MAEGAITSQGQPVTEAHDHDHDHDHHHDHAHNHDHQHQGMSCPVCGNLTDGTGHDRSMGH